MGEAMRRYWHPIASSVGLTSDVPHRTKVLGEDLIVFRDGSGRAGVVSERCAHRGSSLFYGRIEDDGIRCCYHGWKYDVQGHCVEQACEPDRGRRRDAVRQPWYPVEERYGLIFVYMGPPEHKPPLPRYELLEDLDEGESIFSQIPVPGFDVTGLAMQCNWLQAYENAMDPIHAMWLHYTHSGPQFDGIGEPDGFPHHFFDPYAVPGTIEFEKTAHGPFYRQRFHLDEPDGSKRDLEWRVECHVPNIIALPDFVKIAVDQRPDCLIWNVPCDDTSYRNFIAIRSTSIDRMLRLILGIKQNGKFPWELAEEDAQRYPGDNEAIFSQGPITQHSTETLATMDKGVVMLRRMLLQMVDDVAAGRDPLNVERGQAQPRAVKSGVYTVGQRTDDRHPATSAAT
jgi:nitrite reductase/ring-hydroxylating ferredoxin subunit